MNTIILLAGAALMMVVGFASIVFIGDGSFFAAGATLLFIGLAVNEQQIEDEYEDEYKS
jgi:ABC-type branched-subunit amino acid transport system permease subunit